MVLWFPGRGYDHHQHLLQVQLKQEFKGWAVGGFWGRWGVAKEWVWMEMGAMGEMLLVWPTSVSAFAAA